VSESHGAVRDVSIESGPGSAGAGASRLFWVAFVVAALLTLWTLPDYGLASDVGNYLTDSLLQLAWVRDLLASRTLADLGRALSRDTIVSHWAPLLVVIPHPPLSRELGGLTYALLHRWVGWLVSYRVATGLGFAALVGACGALVYRDRRSWVAGISAAAGVIGIPALFAYGHLALTDMLLTVFWFTAVAALEVHVSGGGTRWLWAAGILLGAAIATKFTGLLLVPVLAAWLAVRRAFTWRRAATITGAALAVFIVTNPLLWVDPVHGLGRFLAAGFERSTSPGTMIRTYYLGHAYRYRPPWTYPFVWTLVSLPAPLLLAAGAGLVAARRSRLVALCALNFVVMYGALMVPTAPMHDGVRLFLPALPFFAVLAGLGAEVVAGRLRVLFASPRLRPSLLTVAAPLLLVGPAVVATARVHPYELSYFNGLIGGVRGAQTRGLEVSNMKEVLTPAVLERLASRIPRGSIVDPDFFFQEVCFYEKYGRMRLPWRVQSSIVTYAGQELTVRCDPNAPHGWSAERGASAEPSAYLFVLNRRGIFDRLETTLMRFGGVPFFRVALDGVPLMSVYRVTHLGGEASSRDGSYPDER